MRHLGVVVDTRFEMDTDTHMEEGHFYSPAPPMSGDNKAETLLEL